MEAYRVHQEEEGKRADEEPRALSPFYTVSLPAWLILDALCIQKVCSLIGWKTNLPVHVISSINIIFSIVWDY